MNDNKPPRRPYRWYTVYIDGIAARRVALYYIPR